MRLVILVVTPGVVATGSEKQKVKKCLLHFTHHNISKKHLVVVLSVYELTDNASQNCKNKEQQNVPKHLTEICSKSIFIAHVV